MILSINEHWNERAASEDKEGLREFTRSYIVVVDSPEDGPATILADSRIPPKYTPYATGTETDLGARVVDHQCKQEGEGYFTWMVTVKYSSKWRAEAKTDPNPLLRPAILTWGKREAQEPFEISLDDEPVVTSTRETFDPPIMKRANYRTLKIVKNQPSFDPQEMDDYENTVNDSLFHGYNVGKAMLMSATAQEQEEGESTYFQVSYEFEFNKAGWENIRPLDQGYMEVNPGDGALFRPIRDGSGQPISRPRLLNENGAQLDIENEPPHFLEFRAYPRKNFADLGIPV